LDKKLNNQQQQNKNKSRATALIGLIGQYPATNEFLGKSFTNQGAN